MLVGVAAVIVALAVLALAGAALLDAVRAYRGERDQVLIDAIRQTARDAEYDRRATAGEHKRMVDEMILHLTQGPLMAGLKADELQGKDAVPIATMRMSEEPTMGEAERLAAAKAITDRLEEYPDP